MADPWSWLSHSLPCLPADERLSRGFAEPRGRLSTNDDVEAFIQAAFLFVPPAFLLLGAPTRIAQLYRAKVVTLPNRRGAAKLVLSLIVFALQLAVLVTSIRIITDTQQAAQALSLAAAATLGVLSFFEHGRSVSPSNLLMIFLAASCFVDIIEAGLLAVAENLCRLSPVASALFAAKLVLLGLEMQDKTPILREPYRDLCPEERTGYFGNAFFWWVNPIVAAGSSKILSLQDLPPLASSINAMQLRDEIQRVWDKRKRPEHRFALFFTQFRYLWYRNLLILPPRLSFIAFRYSQPLLIRRTIAFVSNSNLSPEESRNEAFRLILLTLVIYTGMSVAKGMYDIRMDRLCISSRMTMVGLIHNRAMTVKDGIFDDSVALTLMSNDAAGVQYTPFIFHQIWSQVLELSVGAYLLFTELGWVFLVPLLIVGITSQGSKFVTSHIADRQKGLSMATQTRISVTKAFLDSIKNIRMMGLIDKMGAKIQAARDHEIKMFISFNWLILAFNASASTLSIFSPVVTLVVYAVLAKLHKAQPLDAGLVFTSLSMISLVTGPANFLLILIPNIAATMARYDRIQKYLVAPDRQDPRKVLGREATNAASDDAGDAQDDTDAQVAIVLRDAIIRPASTSDPVLRNLNVTIRRGMLVVCAGAVGTGKTTLARTLLGDLPPDTGTISMRFPSAAYCAQTAWLTNATIRDIIRGPPGETSPLDQAWYKRVLRACDLEEDLDQMPDGDQTLVGSRGITLSGGQKQRVALARAVYSHRDIIILDDVFSALDAMTEARVVNSLLGPQGLCRELGTTVLLITHLSQHLPIADHIIVLGSDGEILEQGTWDELRTEAGYISKIVLREGHYESQESEQADKDAMPPGPEKNPEEVVMPDLTRMTGDIRLYGYYFSAIGGRPLFLLLVSLTVKVTVQAISPYWLRWWAESDSSSHTTYYASIYLLLAIGAQVFDFTTIITVLMRIAPTASNTLHGRLLRTVMAAPQSFFSSTDTGITLNRFTSDMQEIDGRLPSALLTTAQTFFQLLAQCVLLAVVQPAMAVTLPLTLVVIYGVQRVYLAVSRQARFLDLETKALINSSFLETLEGIPTIRSFAWQRAFAADNARKLDLVLRALYLLMSLQRWLNIVLDMTVLGLALLVMGLAVIFRSGTTGGQIGIALNVIMRANSLLLGMVESWTNLETSLGAISRLRAFERDVAPEDPPEQEDPHGKPSHRLPPPPAWPAHGAIALDKLSATYNPPTLALRDVSVTIAACQKVGVCGRTGSGKSSLLLSLLRLIEIESGSIQIDGLNIQDLPRTAIRSRLITVPQDPMLVMTDTVRQNLDIADAAATDADIIRVLERVGLWSVLQARTASAETAEAEAREIAAAMGGSGSGVTPADTAAASSGSTTPPSPTAILDATMKSLPLSQGQQQLFSLARAVLMCPTRGKVVLLDEATSSVDAATDLDMQRVIREEFRDHTIITVAHRLDTIMDSDMVLVLDTGRVVEAGPPQELLQKEDSLFRKLYGKGPGT